MTNQESSRIPGRTIPAVVLTTAVLLIGSLLAACSSGDGDGAGGRSGEDATETVEAAFDVRPGTRQATVTGAEPQQALTLVDPDGEPLITLRADRHGQAHFSYIAEEVVEVQTGEGAELPFGEGSVVDAGDGYRIRVEGTDPLEVSEPFRIGDRDDHPDADFFEEQAGDLVPEGDDKSVFGYVTMRDGVQLSAMVRLPGPVEDGPYPTVIEYSGYGPSDPDATEPGSMIAGLLGFATVGVNMRGTGCSGGVFDVFDTAQQSDGYDVVEAIARQPWVKHGEVGMVGLSYAGITQLYTAATQPPSLAAITPLSVIEDPWLQQWPGGVYNGGFTKQWLSERDSQAASGGTGWVDRRIDDGDEVCAENQELREQNIDFEEFGRSLVRRPPAAEDRNLAELVRDIDVPVYLTGAWQDEQTGPQFADMLGNFDSAPLTRFSLFNGRHPDGYTPHLLGRWYEFLSLYVDREVPELPGYVRELAPSVFGDEFGVDGLEFEPDRYADLGPDDYDEALARFEDDPTVRVLFDVGAAGPEPGAPVASFEATYDAWPPEGTESLTFFTGTDGDLTAEADPDEGAVRFLNDPDSASIDFFAEDDGYHLMAPTWDFAWEPFPEGSSATFVTEPFEEATVLGGPARADLFVKIPDGDADLQVTVSLIDDSGTEWSVTSGLLRASDRAFDEDRSTDRFVARRHAAADTEEMPVDEWVPVSVRIPSFAQAVRAGERIAVTVSGPGRDFAAWTFTSIGEPGTPRDIGTGGDRASSITFGILPGIDSIPDLDAPCPSLRGQACRPFTPREPVPAP